MVETRRYDLTDRLFAVIDGLAQNIISPVFLSSQTRNACLVKLSAYLTGAPHEKDRNASK